MSEKKLLICLIGCLVLSGACSSGTESDIRFSHIVFHGKVTDPGGDSVEGVRVEVAHSPREPSGEIEDSCDETPAEFNESRLPTDAGGVYSLTYVLGLDAAGCYTFTATPPDDRPDLAPGKAVILNPDPRASDTLDFRRQPPFDSVRVNIQLEWR